MPTIERINKSTFKFNSDYEYKKEILDEVKTIAPLQKRKIILIQLIFDYKQ